MPVLENPRHERFAQARAKGSTAIEAHGDAGYKPDDGNASKLDNRPDVLARVQEITSAAAKRVGSKVDRIVQELERVAFADITGAVEWGEAVAVRPHDGDGDDEPVLVQGVILKPSASLPAEITAAIAEVAKTKEGIRVKFHDKMAALEKLGKFHGIFKERIEHSGTVTLADLVDASLAPKEGK